MEVQDLWKRVNDAIRHNSTTQRALALKCGFTERRIESLSSGNRLPDAVEITKIAKALDTTVEYLVTGEDVNAYKEKYDSLVLALKNLLQ